MAEADLQTQKRAIMHFFDRADQCERVAPVAAYFARFAGMKKGLEFKPIHPDIQAICLATMTRLEKDKERLGIAGTTTEPEKAAQQIDELKAFALTVFGNADRTDQLGARDNKLVMKYMAAGTFLQALAACRADGLDEKETELLRYSRVRSVEISKAIRSGTEVPPPRAAAPADTSAQIDVESELDEFIAAPPQATSGRYTASEAAAAAANVEAARKPSHAPSWNDLPAAPGHAPPPSAAERLPAIFTRGKRHAGARILFKKDEHSAPQEGRVVNTTATSATVTTASSTATASAAQLAPYLPSGSEVMIQSPDSSGPAVVSATVIRDTAETQWPPVYSVRLPDARTLDVTHDKITAVSAPGTAAARPASPLPPPPATLPGVPKQNFGLAAPDAAPPPSAYPSAPPLAPPTAHSTQPPPPPPSNYPPPATWQPPAAPTAPPAAPRPAAAAAPPAANAAMVMPLQGTPAVNKHLTIKEKDAVKKLAKQAISALNFDDPQSAMEALCKAVKTMSA